MSESESGTNGPHGIVERIVSHALGAPDRSAVKDPARTLTYGELRTEVEAVAASLAARGIRPGDFVGLHLTNSVDFVVAALATISLGAAFVPLAVTDPPRRLTMILADCAPALVVIAEPSAGSDDRVVQSAQNEAFADWTTCTVAELTGADAQPAPTSALPFERPAYVIYTSGTTNTPKGVVVGQGAFVAAVRASVEALDLGPNTRTLSVSAVHFDGSFGTVFTTLWAGGTLVFVALEALHFPRTFIATVERESINYTGFSPTYLRLLLADRHFERLASGSLRTVALGGEACPGTDVAALQARLPRLEVFNRYGPTETAIAVTHFHVTPADAGDVVVSIGTPHPGVTFRIFDEAGRLIEGADEVGELFIGGSQLMNGYLGAPELTAAVLRTDLASGELLYRSGDLVRRDAAGRYHYVDRADRVIKRSGVRISLVELTDALRGVDSIADAACAAYETDEGETGIVGFVVLDQRARNLPSDGADLTQGITRSMRAVLPATMVPDRIEVVARLPMTPAGKVDERRLLSEAGLSRKV